MMLNVKPSTTTNGQTTALLSRASVTSAGQQLILPKHGNGTFISTNHNHLNGYTSSRVGLSTTTSANTTNSMSSGHAIASMVHHKLQQSSKSNLHTKQMHTVIEDKENRRDMVNRQSGVMPTLSNSLASTSNAQQSSSTTSLLKRSKTSDPSRAPLRQKDTAAIAAIQQRQIPLQQLQLNLERT